jgi:hypothetical protein
MKKVRGTPTKSDSSSSSNKTVSTKKGNGSSFCFKFFLFITLMILGLAIFLSINYSQLEPTPVERRGSLGENYFLNKQNLAIYTANFEAKNAKAALLFIHGKEKSTNHKIQTYTINTKKNFIKFFFFEFSGFAEHHERFIGKL